MSQETSFTTPAIYPKMAELLAAPIERLRNALCVHIRPEGAPHSLNTLSAAVNEPFGEQIAFLTLLINRLGQEVMAPNRPSSVELATTLIEQIDATLGKMITSSHAFLRRPWPEGMTEGRVLFAAVLERPLRDLLGFFEQLRCLILDPAHARATHGSETIRLQLVLSADEELKALDAWLARVGKESMRRPRGLVDDFLKVMAGFFLGYWWRKE